jgi:hypothetical protein
MHILVTLRILLLVLMIVLLLLLRLLTSTRIRLRRRQVPLLLLISLEICPLELPPLVVLQTRGRSSSNSSSMRSRGKRRLHRRLSPLQRDATTGNPPPISHAHDPVEVASHDREPPRTKRRRKHLAESPEDDDGSKLISPQGSSRRW